MSEHQFYSNGKLLLTGEYLVLDGAKGLAIPTKYGQNLHVASSTNMYLTWTSFDQNNQAWFEAEYSLPDLNLIRFKGDQRVANTLFQILKKAQEINCHFLNESQGVAVTTYLSFERSWGLGTSSTLINNIAQWAEINAFDLLSKSFGGSGYDIACAQNDGPVVYQIENEKPTVKRVDFNPEFKEELFFVYLNKKQISRDSIKEYRKQKLVPPSIISEVNHITESVLECRSIVEFNKLLSAHEQLISKVLDRPTIQKALFSDYSGKIKSLGAWGGDFVLATGEKAPTDYFRKKGFNTIIAYNDLVKSPI